MQGNSGQLMTHQRPMTLHLLVGYLFVIDPPSVSQEAKVHYEVGSSEHRVDTSVVKRGASNNNNHSCGIPYHFHWLTENSVVQSNHLTLHNCLV